MDYAFPHGKAEQKLKAWSASLLTWDVNSNSVYSRLRICDWKTR